MYKTFAALSLVSAQFKYRQWALSELMLTDTTVADLYFVADTENCDLESSNPIYAKYWNFYDSDIDWYHHAECPCTALYTDGDDTVWSADFDGQFIVNSVQILNVNNSDSAFNDGALVEVVDSSLANGGSCGYLVSEEGSYSQVVCTDGLGLVGDSVSITSSYGLYFCDIIVEGYPVIADYVAQLEDEIAAIGTYKDDSLEYYNTLVSAYDDLTADYAEVQAALTELDGEYTTLLEDYAESSEAKATALAYIGVYESRKLSDSCLYCAPGGCQFCSTPELVTDADLEEEEEEEAEEEEE